MKSSRAFSLAEILIALFILGVGVSLVFNIFPLSLQTFAYSRKLNQVASFAQKKMEELKAHKGPIGAFSSGTEGDITWEVATHSVTIEQGIELTSLELDVALSYQQKKQHHTFITYVSD